MNRRCPPLALLLALISLLTIEWKGKVYAHADYNHKTDLQTAAARSVEQIITVEFGGALGFVYSPQHSFILPGDTIRWMGDFAAHPLVSDDGLWQQVGSGNEFSFTFYQPGSYAYHCFFHDGFGMNGTVTVGEAYFLPMLLN